MKYLVWVLAVLNSYLGVRFLLNVVGLLHTSKYSVTATRVYAVLFLGMGLTALFLSIARHNNKLALIVCAGPWALALLFLLFNMLTSDYK